MKQKKSDTTDFETEPAKLKRVREERVEFWHDMIERVADAAVAYRNERTRSDALHPMRLSGQWQRLLNAINMAKNAQADIDKPILKSEIERSERLAQRAHELVTRPRRSRKKND